MLLFELGIVVLRKKNIIEFEFMFLLIIEYFFMIFLVSV